MEEKKEQPEWLSAAKQNNKRAWEKLVKENESLVYHIAYRMMQNEEEAKDVSQEIFIKVYRNLQKFDEKSAFSTWIYRIAVNTCIDALRKKKGKEVVSWEEQTQHQKENVTDTTETPEEVYLQKEKQLQIIDMIQNLSPEHKAVLLMRDMEDMTYGEIAECLSVSLGTVKSRIARAREQFKKEFLAKKELLVKKPRQINKVNKKGGDTI
ncbi:MAG: sigma-70 family RNA polymerase sigma factor [Firmicutes bacterium]|nr:sigma-70 family RNA polymerase sigma factor [Bacillota bacterium]